MRDALRRLGPRYGVGVGLLALVAIVVLGARLISHQPPRVPDMRPPLPGPSGAVPDMISASALVADTPTGLYSPRPPETLPGTPAPAEVALDFARTWLAGPHETAKAWVRNLSGTATPEVVADLVSADPSAVPATRITGPATVVGDTATSCDVHVPTDAGTLVLTVRASAGRWLVAAVDWVSA